jgi:hypothetical protein
MAQQNIDFGAFPDDPSADAIRSAFQKVQENFNEVYSGITSASVASVNRSVGAGITVNAPTGNVVVTANIANVTVSSPNLQFGTSLGVLASSTVYTSSTQTLYIVVPNTFSIGNIVLSGNANISGNLSIGGNVSLGNITANYFIGSGNNLSNIQGANVSGAVPSATTAITVTSNAQPNITSLGTLTSLSVTGNIVSGNANLGNSATANYFIGSGNNLSNIQSANITGTVANANYAAYAGDVVNASQSNITSLGTLTSVSVSGNANIGNIGTGIITATGNITGANLITGGTLSVTGNANVGNIGAIGVYATTLSATGNANVGNIGAIGVYATTLSATGNANVGNIGATGVVATTLEGSLTTNAQPNITSIGILTSISVSGNANIGNIGTGIITATGNITGANLITGGTLSVTGNTTVGNLSVLGNLTAGNIVVDSIVNGNSNVDITNLNGNITMGVNGNADVFIATGTGVSVTGTLNASANITSPQLISNIVTGTAPFVVSSTTQVANLSVATAGSANLAGTVTTNAQPNITSIGNLVGLTVSNSSGVVNLSNTADVTLGTVANLHIAGGANNQVLLTDGAGNLTWASYVGVSITAANNEVIFNNSGNLVGSSSFTFNNATNTLNATNITGTTISASGNANAGNLGISGLFFASGNINGGNLGTGGLITASGNIQGANLITGGIISAIGNANVGNIGATNGVFTNVSGNGSSLISITGANVTGAVSYATTANSVAVANISGIGNIATVNLDGNVSNILYGNGVFAGPSSAVANANYSNFAGTAYSVSGANVTGTVANATFATSAGSATTAGTVTTAAQPNITSVGTLTSLSVSGNITSGNISATNHTGTTSNITGQYITTLATGTAPLVVTSTTQVANLNVATAGTAGSATTAGTVTTAAQPNITSVGTLTSVSISGNANVGNLGTGGLIIVTGNVTGANVIANSYIIRSVNAAVSAAGSTQGTATILAKEFNRVSTVASGSGVVLPSAVAGMAITIVNTSANTLLVYPAAGAQINALAANVAFSQPTLGTIQFISLTGTQWYTVGGTYA